jgi:hypothetical protein
MTTPLVGHLDVVVGEAGVAFAFVATNPDADPVDVTFRSGQVADIAVYGNDRAEVWRWSDDRMFTQAVRTETVEPGGSLSHRAVWEDPEPGEYVAEASLEATDATLVVRAEFEV